MSEFSLSCLWHFSLYPVRDVIFNNSFTALLPSALWMLQRRTKPHLEKYKSSVPSNLRSQMKFLLAAKNRNVVCPQHTIPDHQHLAHTGHSIVGRNRVLSDQLSLPWLFNFIFLAFRSLFSSYIASDVLSSYCIPQVSQGHCCSFQTIKTGFEAHPLSCLGYTLLCEFYRKLL